MQYKVAKPESALQPFWCSDPVLPWLLPLVAANLSAALSLEVEFTLQGFPTILKTFVGEQLSRFGESRKGLAH